MSDNAEHPDSGMILVIDDEPVVRKTVQLALEPLGRELIQASCVDEGVELLGTEDIDVAVIDKNLPDGNGIDFIRRLKESNPETEALLVTGYGSLESALEAIHAGIFDYIRKPFDVHHLRARVDVALGYVDEKRRRGKRLQNVYRMEALGRLSASIGHEINNPLSYVLSNVEFLDRRIRELSDNIPPAIRAELLDATNDVHVGADRIRSIVRDLTVLARREKEDRAESVEIERTVRSALKVVSNQLRHNAQVEVDLGEAPAIEGSDLRLFQVLINLLVNANQALPAGEPANRIEVSTGTDAHGWARISITDNGGGIDPEIVDRIFDRFFTTKEFGEGTGLGLNISKRYIESMGGRIEVSSELGSGATFSIHLPPRQLSLAPPLSESFSELPAVAERASVLLIDDDILVLKAMARALREHHVEVVVGGEAAIEVLAKRRDFDLILCDVMMPGADGMDVYKYLEQHDPELAPTIVFMTGGTFTNRTEEFATSISNHFLEKPIAPLELERLVRERAASRR